MLSGIFTVLTMLAFAAVVLWAWDSRNKARFDEAARLPLDEDEVPPVSRATRADNERGDS